MFVSYHVFSQMSLLMIQSLHSIRIGVEFETSCLCGEWDGSCREWNYEHRSRFYNYFILHVCVREREVRTIDLEVDAFPMQWSRALIGMNGSKRNESISLSCHLRIFEHGWMSKTRCFSWQLSSNTILYALYKQVYSTHQCATKIKSFCF